MRNLWRLGVDNRGMRQPRLIAPSVPHQITLRGNNQRRLFSRRWEYDHFLTLLEKAATKHAVSVHAVALMTNHVHLVVTPPSTEAASKFVKSFAQAYAQTRNKRRGGSGKLFEERFNSDPLATDEAVACMTAYVDLNPANAGLCKRRPIAAWSTHGLHVGRGDEAGIPASLWTPSPWYLGLGATSQARQAAYAAWIAESWNHQQITRRAKQAANVEVRRPNRKRAT